MEVLIVRHAMAADRDEAKWPDDAKRPLIRRGILRFRRVARRLRRVVPVVDGIFSSPLVRAWDTAGILSDVARWPAPVELAALVPGARPAALKSFLKSHGDERIVLVGHEPGLHEAVSYFLTGSEDGFALEMKKGGAALLRFEGKPEPGQATLLWLLPPRLVLREQ